MTNTPEAHGGRHIIKLTDATMTEPRQRRVRFADLVIDHRGRVIKDRYGVTGRNATGDELAQAVKA